jgi:hypothetical protein
MFPKSAYLKQRKRRLRTTLPIASRVEPTESDELVVQQQSSKLNRIVSIDSHTLQSHPARVTSPIHDNARRTQNDVPFDNAIDSVIRICRRCGILIAELEENSET